MNLRTLSLGLLLPAAAALAALRPMTIEELKGPSCIIQDSVRKSETVLAPTLTRVNLLVTDGYAQATVTQAFINPLVHRTEIAYVFPLPEKGAVHAMSFQTGGKYYRARIEEKAKAQALYDSAKAAGAQAGLLLQERPNLFQQKLANLGAGDTVWVELKVTVPLKYTDGWWELSFPTMVGTRYPSAGSTEPVGTISGWNPPATREGPAFQFNVLVQASSPLDSIVSPTHPIQAHDIPSAQATLVNRRLIDSLSIPEATYGKALWLVEQPTYPNSDFVLRLHRASTALDGSMLSCRPSGADTGFFRLSLFPDLTGPKSDNPLDVVLLIDHSGSQYGVPLADQKAIAKHILSRLTAADNLTVIAFADAVTYANGRTPVPATAANLETARDFIDAIEAYGSTQLLTAIQASLAVPPASGRSRSYVFLTDGLITNEADILAALQRAVPSPTVFTFGCGSNLNRYFLEEAAKVGNGFATIVIPGMDVDSATDAAWNRIQTPQVTGVSADFAGFPVMDGIAANGSTLYLGLPWTLSGRYVGKGPSTVTLKGTRAGSPWTLTRNVTFSGSCPVDRTTPLVWARETIGALETAEGTGTANKARIIALSKTYQVLSKYTAFLALDGIPLAQAEIDLSAGMSLEIASDATKNPGLGLKIAQTRLGGRLILAWTGSDLPRSWTLTSLQGRTVARWGAVSRVEWDGRNLQGGMVPAGTYLLRVVTAQGAVTVPVNWMP